MARPRKPQHPAPQRASVRTYDGLKAFVHSMTQQPNTFTSGAHQAVYLSRNRPLLDMVYTSSWVAAKIIDAVAEDMTSDGVNIEGLSTEEDKALQRYLVSSQVWSSLTDTIKWARLYGGAVGYIVIDGQDPVTPLDVSTVGRGQFLGITVYDRYRAIPDMLQLDMFNEPQYYSLDMIQTPVHCSRLVKMVGDKLPYYEAQSNDFWGASILNRVLDKVKFRERALEATGKLIDKAYSRLVKVEGLRNVLAAGGKAEANLIKMFDYMRLLQNEQGLVLMDNKDTYQVDSYTFTGLGDLLKGFDYDVAGACDIPVTRLYGQSPAGFSTGDSDLKTYYDKITRAQESTLREPLTKILNVAYQSLFGHPVSGVLDFKFLSPWRPNEIQDRAQLVAECNLLISAAQAGLLPPEKAMANLKAIGTKYELFSSLDDNDISQARGSLQAPSALDDFERQLLGEPLPEPDDTSSPDAAVTRRESLPDGSNTPV